MVWPTQQQQSVRKLGKYYFVCFDQPVTYNTGNVVSFLYFVGQFILLANIYGTIASRIQGSANERRRYNVTSSLIGWAHSQINLWVYMLYHVCSNKSCHDITYDYMPISRTPSVIIFSHNLHKDRQWKSRKCLLGNHKISVFTNKILKMKSVRTITRVKHVPYPQTRWIRVNKIRGFCGKYWYMYYMYHYCI